MRLVKRGLCKGSQLLVLALICVALGGTATRTQTGPKSGNRQFVPLIRSVEGPDLFRAYCSSCHGVNGKGGGPAAQALKVKPPDLALLTKKNGGHFPVAQVRKTILGDEVLAAHGSREMPIWGPIFHQIESDVDRGNVRLENLLKYLESIQLIK